MNHEPRQPRETSAPLDRNTGDRNTGGTAESGPVSTPARWQAGTVIETLSARGIEAPLIRLQADQASSERPSKRNPVEPDLLATSRGRGNYRVLGEIGRDVLSYVLEAEDSDLGRTVAMKVLRDEHLNHPLAVRVFVQEARVAAQLQHEGILPVYDFGLHPDGRPYYTMKVVRGVSLATLLARRKSVDADRRRFLAIFERVCKAVAYAHTRGVAHCGLDPQHIIVGAQDETQVVHWASARFLTPAASGGAAESRPIAAPENHAYMAPEAARGDVDACDERTDVFALGSLLCEILTGAAAYGGAKAEEARTAAGQARLDDAYRRLDECTDGRELVALAKNCLVAGQSARPRSGVDVLGALNLAMLSLDERRGQAEFTAQVARDEAHRERRIARRSRILAEAVVLAGLLGAAGVYLHLDEREEQRRTVLADIQQEIECVQFLWSQARSSVAEDSSLWDEAMMAVSRATSHLNEPGVDDSVRSRVEFVADSMRLERAEALEVIARAKRDRALAVALGSIGLASAGETGSSDPARVASRCAEVFAAFDLNPVQGQEERVVRAIRESGVRDEILLTLDRWAMACSALSQPRAELLFDVAARADGDDARNALRRALFSGDAALAEQAISALDPRTIEPRTAVLAAWTLRHQARPAQAVELLRAAQGRTPGDFSLSYELAECFDDPALADTREAVRYYTSALGARPRSADVRQRLSYALQREGKLEESMEVLLVALEEHPDDAHLQVQLGSLYHALGQKERATEIWRGAVEAESVQPSSLALLGEELRRAGDLAGARFALERWVNLAPDDAQAHVALAGLLREQGELTHAAQRLSRAAEIDVAWGRPRVELGDLYAQMGRGDDALQCYFAALRLAPRDAALKRKLGAAFEGRKEWDSAAVALKESLIVDPTHEETAARLFMLLSEQVGSPDAAAAAFQEIAQAQPQSALAWYYVGRAQFERGELTACATALGESVRLRPDEARARGLLGRVQLEQGETEEALEQLRAAVRLEPSRARLHVDLGIALAHLGQLEPARQAFEGAISLDPKDADLHYRMGSVQQRLGDLEAARLSYVEAIRQRPSHAEAHCNLGGLFKQQGDYVASLEAYRLGHELGVKRGDWSYPSKEWLTEAERMVAEESQLEAVVRGAAPPAQPEALVRLASMAHRKGLSGTSARLYASAMEQTGMLGQVRSLDRYEAARAAVQAGSGSGAEAQSLADDERARWRSTGLDWLESELITLLERNSGGRLSDEDLRATLEGWLGDPDLAGIRDASLLATLPEAERQNFVTFWVRVAGLVEER